jgi:rod shape-determining protein MreC
MARVSGTSPTVWYRRITINKGTADGVRVDQPVITGSGLVGKVETAVGHSAVVMLLTDSAFNAGAKVSETGVTGVIQPAVGSPGRLVLQYTTSRDQVTENEKVVTQGTDSKRFESLFPKDIPIGYVTKVDEPGTDAQVVHVRPYVDVRRLDYVQVLTKKVDGNR